MSDAEFLRTVKYVCQLDKSGLYLGLVAANPSPLEPGVYLIPGGAIDCEPPSTVRPGVAHRAAENGKWIELQDFRGQNLYRIADGEPYQLGTEYSGATFEGVGDLPSWLTTEQRPTPWSVWSNGSWVDDNELKTAQTTSRNLQELRARMDHAALVIAPLIDAEELGIATDAEAARLRSWRLYRVELSRIDPTSEEIAWPSYPGKV
ncbi:tail fiber assembly protein [Achromobacter xylosoxidans]|uniref:tail fiber assembly protein n=1 Tax=Alcaligenes xylosoxydans xylosoxydans TaxID=85698 RepID=UPI0012A92DDA|nr:tail fiber assembly protein [Achromobacter xylosoxidans]CUR79999.1 Caudovirales tail fibre assembly protein [Achromobacter xylosoxidans]